MKKALVIRYGAYKCLICGKSFESYDENAKYCSRPCYYKSRVGKKTWNFGLNVYLKGGGIVSVKDNASCIKCGKSFHIKEYSKKKGKGKYCSKACYMIDRSEWMKDKAFNPAYKVDFSLHNNPNWNGGSSFEPYPLGWTNTFKEQIRFRDKYTCGCCGVSEVEHCRKLDVHHIDYNKNNLSPSNLISLCKACHSRTNGNREYWINYFLKKDTANV
jgi:endogenous inhibitor of DNA gyrase (YacG/DUF329 family)